MAVYKRNKTYFVYYYITIGGRRIKRGKAVGPRKDVAEVVEKKYREMIKQGLDPKEEIPAHAEPFEIAYSQPEVTSERIITLREFYPMFLELHGNHQSMKMQESYNTSFSHFAPGFGDLHLSGITKVKVQKYMTRRKRSGLTNATVNREIAFLKSMLQRAVDWGYLDRNPLNGLKLLKEAPIRERYLTKDEADRLIHVAPRYLRDIILFALATGFRKSEIFGLTWANVIMNRRFRYGEITVVGKGNKRRNIRMNRTVHELLSRMCRDKESDYVFPSPKTGRKIDNVNRAFKTACYKAGIDNFRFHDLRHTAASWMVQGGADVYAVQKILGHTHIRTTQRYAHQSPEYLESQISVLDDFLSPDVGSKQNQSDTAIAV